MRNSTVIYAERELTLFFAIPLFGLYLFQFLIEDLAGAIPIGFFLALPWFYICPFVLGVRLTISHRGLSLIPPALVFVIVTPLIYAAFFLLTTWSSFQSPRDNSELISSSLKYGAFNFLVIGAACLLGPPNNSFKADA